MEFHGKISTFGGPTDGGVDFHEGLALIAKSDLKNWWFRYLFLPNQPIDTTGLARRLDPSAYYIAMRWNYWGDNNPSLLPIHTPRNVLRQSSFVLVKANGKSALARPVDWGPHVKTGRIADISPGLATYLNLSTDEEATFQVIQNYGCLQSS